MARMGQVVAAAAGSVRQLNTRAFSATVRAYANHIATFEQISTNVDNALGNLLDNWRGPGRDAFGRDLMQICQCLEDVHGSMCELRQTLEAAEREYLAADQGVASAIRG